MRVIMLSWEYPPMRVGGIAAALEGLCPALARAGVEVHVVTCGASGGAVEEEQAPGLFIHRVQVTEQSNDFLHWVHHLNYHMELRAAALIERWKAEEAAGAAPAPKRGGRTAASTKTTAAAPSSSTSPRPILLHVHDWLGMFAGRALKFRYHLPMLSTIHATEYGRNSGIHTEIQRYINHCEWDLQYESWRVIVCSAFMRGEVGHALQTPWDKIDIVYNGVETDTFDFAFPDDERQAFRDRYAAPNEKIIYFIGRPVREKGAQLLIEALPIVRGQYYDAKLVIAGGGARGHLEHLAATLGVSDRVLFTGRVSDEDRDRLYRVADVACYPSLYEPFGIVALEAMAARVPVVVSDAGGLPEVVQHDESGTVVYSGSPDSLAWGIVRVLKNPGFAQYLAGNAFERVEAVFNWDLLATQTKAIYERVWSEYVVSDFAKLSS